MSEPTDPDILEFALLGCLCLFLTATVLPLVNVFGGQFLIAILSASDAPQSTAMDVLEMMALPAFGLVGTFVAAALSISFSMKKGWRIWSLLIAMGLAACAVVIPLKFGFR